jgi:hypothetical protein
VSTFTLDNGSNEDLLVPERFVFSEVSTTMLSHHENINESITDVLRRFRGDANECAHDFILDLNKSRTAVASL